jgi:hypothetical protein
MYGNDIVGYNGSNQKHGLEVSSTYADLILNFNGNPYFKIYNDLSGVSFRFNSTEFIISNGNQTIMENAWYLNNTDSSDLIKPQGYIDSFAKNLTWDDGTRTLTLKDANGNTLASVVISS